MEVVTIEGPVISIGRRAFWCSESLNLLQSQAQLPLLEIMYCSQALS